MAHVEKAGHEKAFEGEGEQQANKKDFEQKHKGEAEQKQADHKVKAVVKGGFREGFRR